MLRLFDLATGTRSQVPGTVGTNPGLTFSPDGRWLAIALDEGSGVRVLLWRPGLSAPRELPGAVPGKAAFSPPLLAVP